ncbi:MAG: response regulator transcription factor [bacterium]|nr:response regulator transcription factor [bacterium]
MSQHPTGQPIRVVIVDDHKLVRDGLRALLFDAPDIAVVGEAADGEKALHAAETLGPSVILMDLVMPVMDGVAATAGILERHPEIRIVALSGSGREDKILAAIDAGALGFVSKNGGKDETVDAIRKVARGEPSLPPALTRKLLRRFRPTSALAEAELTERETEILRLLARGLSNREIAERIHVAVGTVRIHLSTIYSKIGTGNRVLATLWALREGVASLDDGVAQDL